MASHLHKSWNPDLQVSYPDSIKDFHFSFLFCQFKKLMLIKYNSVNMQWSLQQIKLAAASFNFHWQQLFFYTVMQTKNRAGMLTMLKMSTFQIAILMNSITGTWFLVFYCKSVCHISTKKMSKDFFFVAWRWRYSDFELYDCMSMWGGRFCGYPCQTNEPAELAGCGGSSVDWSRAKQSVLWFTGPMISQRVSLLGCSTTLTTSACVFPFPD